MAPSAVCIQIENRKNGNLADSRVDRLSMSLFTAAIKLQHPPESISIVFLWFSDWMSTHKCGLFVCCMHTYREKERKKCHHHEWIDAHIIDCLPCSIDGALVQVAQFLFIFGCRLYVYDRQFKIQFFWSWASQRVYQIIPSRALQKKPIYVCAFFRRCSAIFQNKPKIKLTNFNEFFSQRMIWTKSSSAWRTENHLAACRWRQHTSTFCPVAIRFCVPTLAWSP